MRQDAEHPQPRRAEPYATEPLGDRLVSGYPSK